MRKQLLYAAIGLFIVGVVAVRAWARSRGTPSSEDLVFVLTLILVVVVAAGLGSLYARRKHGSRV